MGQLGGQGDEGFVPVLLAPKSLDLIPEGISGTVPACRWLAEWVMVAKSQGGL